MIEINRWATWRPRWNHWPISISLGFSIYPGKPWLAIIRTFYDCPIRVLHFGPFWVQVDG